MFSLGVVCALLAPLAWAGAVIFFKRASTLPALGINLFKNVLAVVLLGGTMLALGTKLPTDRSVADWARLGVSGLLGLALADNLLFEGLRRIGAARLAVVDTIYAPAVVLLAWAFLGESPSPIFLVGAAAVIAGVTVANVDPTELRSSVPGLRVGSLFAAGGILGTATGVVLARPVLVESDLVEVTFTRLCFGVAGQLVWILVSGRRDEALAGFRFGPAHRALVPGAILGTWLSLLLWLGGFKWAPAATAAVLNQLATVYMLAFARIFLGETLRPRQLAGAALAAGGALWIVLTRA